MQTSLAFLSVLSFALIGSQFIDQPDNSEQVQNVDFSNNAVSGSPKWQVTILGSNVQCDITTRNSAKNMTVSANKALCDEAIPGINELGRIDTDSNANLTLFSATGKRLAQFMESESGHYESIWPQYPLMTMAQIN
ncbi:hypothetical protein MNBD_ALPHA03-813 [hydrothermal vent metagenome]|uniref:Alkaline proteinase inhibitor/ Outer membrane lipoprotein Omp19 domain-containing protein n=1 Tax=hydrothermal vent metagenome TaxID=652676 RepID=A0A3B1AXP0_9ZZZZ